MKTLTAAWCSKDGTTFAIIHVPENTTVVEVKADAEKFYHSDQPMIFLHAGDDGKLKYETKEAYVAIPSIEEMTKASAVTFTFDENG